MKMDAKELADHLSGIVEQGMMPLLRRISALEQHLGLTPPKVKLKSWTPSTLFAAGERVLFNNQGWTCTRANAGVSPDSPAAADFWKRFS